MQACTGGVVEWEREEQQHGGGEEVEGQRQEPSPYSLRGRARG